MKAATLGHHTLCQCCRNVDRAANELAPQDVGLHALNDMLMPILTPELQYYIHYSLMARAASLAIGTLSALPFLEPGSVQPGVAADLAASCETGATSCKAPRMAVMPARLATLGAHQLLAFFAKLPLFGQFSSVKTCSLHAWCF